MVRRRPPRLLPDRRALIQDEVKAGKHEVMARWGVTYTVFLTEMPYKKIAAIKWVRTFTTLGLKEAKDLVESIDAFKRIPDCGCCDATYDGEVPILVDLDSDELDKALKHASEEGFRNSIRYERM